MPRNRWTKKNIQSLAGRIAIVTGGAGGLGYEIALGLAEAGAEVIIVDRNEVAGKDAMKKLNDLLQKSTKISYEYMDLGNLESVRAFCSRFNDRNEALDILVNNAGIMVSARTSNREVTMDGFEAHFGINYLAHFALVAQLLPSLRRSSWSRVVNVGSLAYRAARINFEDLQMERSYDGLKAYGQSKLAILLFTLELQRRSDEGKWGLTAVTSHPGFAVSGIAAEKVYNKWYTGILLNCLAPMLQVQDAATGALPALFASTDAAVEPGEYYGPSGSVWFETRGRVGTAYRGPNSRDSGTAEKLWDVSVKLTHVLWPDSGSDSD